jgi:hypothetical protein
MCRQLHRSTRHKPDLAAMWAPTVTHSFLASRTPAFVCAVNGQLTGCFAGDASAFPLCHATIPMWRDGKSTGTTSIRFNADFFNALLSKKNRASPTGPERYAGSSSIKVGVPPGIRTLYGLLEFALGRLSARVSKFILPIL